MIPMQPDAAEERAETVSQGPSARIRLNMKAWFAADKSTQWANLLMVQLIIVTLLLRLIWLTNVPQSVIFDEPFYVDSARVILGWPVPEGQVYAGEPAGIDPNRGHMPLAKLMIAGSMVILGDNPVAWRLPSILLGTLAVGFLYLLVRRLTGRPWMALLAAFLLSFESLSFIHGRIAMLDMPMTGLLIMGVYLYLAKQPGLSGATLALSTLAKVTGIMGLIALVGFEILRFFLRKDQRTRGWATLANLLVTIGSFTFVFLALLWVMDLSYTRNQTPFDHLKQDYSIGTGLRDNGPPQNIASEPWQWLLNENTIPYYTVNADVIVDNKSVRQNSLIAFVGQMNPYIIMMLPLALGYILDRIWRKRDTTSLFLLALFGATYGQPLFFALFFDRISYLFYMLPVMPAICASIAYFLLDRRIPRLVPLAYCAAVLFGFAMQFPFRTLPS